MITGVSATWLHGCVHQKVTERDSKSCVYSRARPDAPRMREHATHPNLSESWSDYDYKIIAIMITWLFWARFAVID